MKEIFEDIIKNRRWNDVLCGSGSTLEYTESLRSSLPDFLRKHNIQSMFDAPCGDYSWMSLVQLPEGFKYIGGDIVSFMIDDNRSKYPDVDFRVVDISQDDFPDMDLLFCRDCLFHFSHEDLVKTFANIARSNVKYVLTTSFAIGHNGGLTTGGFRQLRLEDPPYKFEPPIDMIDDWPKDVENTPARYMCLWPRSTFENFKP